MRVLIITPYVTIPGRPEFERNRTGFGLMVYYIAKAIANRLAIDGVHPVDVLATDSLGESFFDNGVYYVKRSLWQMLRCINRIVPFRILLNLLKRYPLSKETRIRLLYYWFLSGYLHLLIDKRNYDVVHIHGCSFANDFWINVCQKKGIKYVVTLHGLNSFSDAVSLEPAGKQYERDFIKRVYDGEIPLTVISTGMKRMIERSFGRKDCKNITVVCNAYNFNDNNIIFSIKSKYNIPLDGKILLSVGNITKNKNQIQIVKAYGRLSDELQKKTYVLFCGRQNPVCGIEAEIAKQKYASHLILCGEMDKTELPSFYSEAFAVVLLSFVEGFGLSLIEGMHFGKPCVTFEDLASYDDIFDPCGVIGVSNRDDSSVADALEKCLTSEWDEDAIKKSSLRFDSKQMANNYINAYNA